MAEKLTLAERVREGSFRARHHWQLLLRAPRLGIEELDELLDEADAVGSADLVRDVARRFAAAVREREGARANDEEPTVGQWLWASSNGLSLFQGRPPAELAEHWHAWNRAHGLAWRLQHNALDLVDEYEVAGEEFAPALAAERAYERLHAAQQERVAAWTLSSGEPFPEPIPPPPLPAGYLELRAQLPELAASWWERHGRDPNEPAPNPPLWDEIGRRDRRSSPQ